MQRGFCKQSQWVWLSLFVVAAASGGCVSSDGRGTEVAIPPPQVDVTRNQAWVDAEAVAGLDPNRFTVIGAGKSMLPVYGENTVLVLQKIPFDDLNPGMNVAYRNQSGRVVVHRLVSRDAFGWRAVGLNNPREDAERVTEMNLLGIVYAAFANQDVK